MFCFQVKSLIKIIFSSIVGTAAYMCGSPILEGVDLTRRTERFWLPEGGGIPTPRTTLVKTPPLKKPHILHFRKS